MAASGARFAQMVQFRLDLRKIISDACVSGGLHSGGWESGVHWGVRGGTAPAALGASFAQIRALSRKVHELEARAGLCGSKV